MYVPISFLRPLLYMGALFPIISTLNSVSSSLGRDFLCFPNTTINVAWSKTSIAKVYEMLSDSSSSSFKMNLKTLEKPLGFRFRTVQKWR